MFKANFPLFHFKEYFYDLVFIKNLFVTYGKFWNKLENFITVASLVEFTPYCPYWTIVMLYLMWSYRTFIYTVYTLEKFIPLLQFAKYVIPRSLLKYVWKGFEIVLRHYVIFKFLNFMHMNSPGSFHPTSDVMSGL